MIYKEEKITYLPPHGVDSSKVEVTCIIYVISDDADVTLTKVFSVPDSGKYGRLIQLLTKDFISH